MSLAIPASGSLPERHSSASLRELPPQFSLQSTAIEEIRRQLQNPTLDLHPFSDEFYLREFATETPTESRRQHSKLAPFTNAASGLSRKVANLRRALARMMP